MRGIFEATWNRNIRVLFMLMALLGGRGQAQEVPVIADVERQPFVAATRRLIEALSYAGSPLPPQVLEQYEQATRLEDDRKAVVAIQQVLDP
ncbi:MAG: hypothetical protein WCK86_14290, partial [Planctomycetia bacterium]